MAIFVAGFFGGRSSWFLQFVCEKWWRKTGTQNEDFLRILAVEGFLGFDVPWIWNHGFLDVLPIELWSVQLISSVGVVLFHPGIFSITSGDSFISQWSEDPCFITSLQNGMLQGCCCHCSLDTYDLQGLKPATRIQFPFLFAYPARTTTSDFLITTVLYI